MNVDYFCGAISNGGACICRSITTAAYWSVVVSVFQALMWHFTEPYTSGFAIFPVVALLGCILLPAVFVSLPLQLSQHTSKILVLLRMTPLVLLLICTIPTSAFFTRSICLAVAVIALQLYAFYPGKTIAHTEANFAELKHSGDNHGDEVITTPHTVVENINNNNYKCNNVSEKQSNSLKTYQSCTEPTCFDLLTGMLIVVSVRWSTLSINVFYENWIPATVAIVCFLAHEILSFLSCGKYIKKVLGVNVVDTKTPHPDPYAKDSYKTELQPPTCTCAYGFGLGILNAVSLATILQLSVWTIASPAFLCRWTGLPFYPHGVIIPIIFCVGICLLVFSERQNVSPCNKESSRQFTRTILSIASLVVVIFGFAVSMYAKSWIGIILICISFPSTIYYNVNFASQFLRTIEQFPSKTQKTCSRFIFVTCFGFMAFLYFIVYLSFQNPRFLTGLQGRYDIIIWVQITLICVATTTNILYWFPRQAREGRNDKGILAYIPSAVIVLMAIIFIGTAIHTSSANKPCINKHNKSFRVLTWNILLGHAMSGDDNLGPLSDFIETHEPDVVGLQESDPWQAFWGGKDSWGFFQTRIGNCYHQYRGAHPEESLLGTGLLSRIEAIENMNQKFPTDSSLKVPLYGFNKITLNVTRKPTESLLHIYTLHALYKNWTCPRKPPTSVISCEQMRALADDVKKLPVTDPVIVMGDFNINPNEPELDVWFDEDFGFKSALSPERNKNLNRPMLSTNEDCIKINKFYKNFTQCNSNDYSYKSTILNRHAQVDHIFYRGLTLQNATIFENIYFSDHKPIIADFLL